MYEGTTRKPTIAKKITTAATSMKPRIVSPRCVLPGCRIPLPLPNPAADTLEREARDVVPVEPDEEGASPDVVVGNESPVAAVVARVPVVAHHEVVACRHLAGEASLIVVTIIAVRERPDPPLHDGRGRRIDGDRVVTRPLVGARLLDAPLGRLESQPLEIAVAAIGPLRQRRAVHDNLFITIFDDVAADADDALDEI